MASGLYVVLLREPLKAFFNTHYMGERYLEGFCFRFSLHAAACIVRDENCSAAGRSDKGRSFELPSETRMVFTAAATTKRCIM